MTPSELAQKIHEKQIVHIVGEPGQFSYLMPADLTTLRHYARPVIKEQNIVRFSELEDVLAAGATIYFKNIARKIPAIGALLEDVKQVTQSLTVQAAIVHSRGTEHGYYLHQDPFNLIVLQVAGKRHWHVHTETVNWNAILNDGDMLLVPKDWWHIVQPMGPSTHITLQFTHERGSMAPTKTFAQLSPEEQEWHRRLIP